MIYEAPSKVSSEALAAWLRPLHRRHLSRRQILLYGRTRIAPTYATISATNCLYSQPLSLRLRRPRTLRSLTAVQFSKSWGESGVGHDPAFTRRGTVARAAANLPFNRGSTGPTQRSTGPTQRVMPRASSSILEHLVFKGEDLS